MTCQAPLSPNMCFLWSFILKFLSLYHVSSTEFMLFHELSDWNIFQHNSVAEGKLGWISVDSKNILTLEYLTVFHVSNPSPDLVVFLNSCPHSMATPWHRVPDTSRLSFLLDLSLSTYPIIFLFYKFSHTHHLSG